MATGLSVGFAFVTRPLVVLAWFLVLIDLGLAALMATSRGGDAATRGLGPGLGSALAALAVVAAILLWVGRATERGLLVVLGGVLAAAPVALGLALTVSRQRVLGLIYPSMHDRTARLPSPKYAFPDAAGRAAALAIVMNDYEKLDSILRATPAPDLMARDERGVSLLGLATTAAIMDGGTMRDLDGLRLLLSAGAKPRPDDLGPGETLIEAVASDRNVRTGIALEWLLDAGLSPDSPIEDGRHVLFHPYLGPKAARLLLARGADRMVRDGSGGRPDWSAVTYQADNRRWATALALLEGGVAVDFGMPAGSVLARVVSHDDSADPAFQAFMAAATR